MLRLFTTLSNSLALWQITRPQGYKQNLFFRFLIFFRFRVFFGYFYPKMAENSQKWPKKTQKRKNIKNLKNKFCSYP